ncbi:hypothetical protein CHS0354_015334 [Potamilus streckersoni]|uniref:Uncharacterized protein n=1 Tax=Potamilus streckersoni TaxID=2493646 RepID=A0AAE0SUR8_9BIVA|nr:hypothetical protein CHS0354_015334 [Potamilus streckersoni]
MVMESDSWLLLFEGGVTLIKDGCTSAGETFIDKGSPRNIRVWNGILPGSLKPNLLYGNLFTRPPPHQKSEIISVRSLACYNDDHTHSAGTLMIFLMDKSDHAYATQFSLLMAVKEFYNRHTAKNTCVLTRFERIR